MILLSFHAFVHHRFLIDTLSFVCFYLRHVTNSVELGGSDKNAGATGTTRKQLAPAMIIFLHYFCFPGMVEEIAPIGMEEFVGH